MLAISGDNASDAEQFPARKSKANTWERPTFITFIAVYVDILQSYMNKCDRKFISIISILFILFRSPLRVHESYSGKYCLYVEVRLFSLFPLDLGSERFRQHQTSRHVADAVSSAEFLASIIKRLNKHFENASCGTKWSRRILWTLASLHTEPTEP